MNKQECEFDQWFDMLCLYLAEEGVIYRDRKAVREDYDAGMDVYEVGDQIVLEYR